MNRILFSALLALAVLVSACDKQSSVTSPSTTGTSVTAVQKMISTVSFTNEQIALVDEMFYLGEDLSLILPPAQVNAIDCVTGTGSGLMGDHGTFDKRRAVDMDALIYLQLVIRANPGIDTATVSAIRDLIAANYLLRVDAINNTTDTAALKTALQALHTQLMTDINAKLTQGQIDAALALKARIEVQRAAERAKMDSLRIESQVKYMTAALALSTDQANAVKALLYERLAAVEALRTQYAGDPEGFRTALKALMDDYNTKLETLLGTDLYAKWVALQAGMGGGGHHGGGGHMGGGHRR